VRSLPAMVPAVIPMLLLMIPAMLTALAVVREKELGSIINLYVTPVTRSEFLLGKQLPNILLAMLNFALLTLLAVTVFGVPLKGSLLGADGRGAALRHLLDRLRALRIDLHPQPDRGHVRDHHRHHHPGDQFAGMLNPVSSLEGVGHLIGQVYPAAHFLTITRGIFNKALGFAGLEASFWPLALAVPVILAAVDPAVEEAGALRMAHLANIYRLCIKELWSLARDPMMLVLIAYTFTVSIYVAATAMPETLHKAPIAIVDEDASPLSVRIASAFYPPRFDPPAMISLSAIDAGLDAGTYTFVLDIPPDFPARCAGRTRAHHSAQCRCHAHEPGVHRQQFVQQMVLGEVTAFMQGYRGSVPLPVELALRTASIPTWSSPGSAR
jgi:hypothetical protein